MNFDKEVGQKITLIVSQFAPHGGTPKINFEPKFETVDPLITRAVHAAKSEAEHEGDRIRDERDMMNYFERGYNDSYDRRRNRTCEYSTMRIYHLSGDQHPELVVGDEWECEVVKCYARTTSTPRKDGPDKIEWIEPKTKDGRIKIHYTVRPVTRVVTETRDVDWDKKGMMITRSCGKNTSRETLVFDEFVEGAFRHSDSLGGNWVVFGAVGYNNGAVVASRVGPKENLSPEAYPWRRSGHFSSLKMRSLDESVQTANRWMTNENQKYGGGIQTKRLKAFWRELPVAPYELWEVVIKEGLCERALERSRA